MNERRRVLLVDDEPSIVKMVGKRLELEGYHVILAMDGQDGLVKAQADPPPNVVILDLMLPKLNGYEVCAMLKRDPKYQHIPVMIFSAKAQEGDRVEALCGADAYLRKPFKAQELLERIKTLMDASLPPPQP